MCLKKKVIIRILIFIFILVSINMLSKFDKPYIKFETNGSFHMYVESSKVKPSDKIHHQTTLLENEFKPVQNRRN